MIAVTGEGNFVTSGGALTATANPEWQNFMSESRCLQGTYFADDTFGRNPLVWGLSQSPKDRIADLTRIGNKYVVVTSISYNTQTQVYKIQ